jgi:hypothetical protein
MKAIKGIFKNGQLHLTEPAAEEGPVEVMVIFPYGGADPWEAILNETAPRAAFAKFMAEALEEIDAGKAEPLDLDVL